MALFGKRLVTILLVLLLISLVMACMLFYVTKLTVRKTSKAARFVGAEDAFSKITIPILLLLENWIYISIALIVLVIVIALYEKLIIPHFYELYKRLLKYDKTLEAMRAPLEEDYTDLWNEPEFCFAYLKYYEKYQHFLSVARSDSAGKMLGISRYHKYTKVDMK